MKEQNTETYNTNPDEKKSTKFDPHDFPKEEEENKHLCKRSQNLCKKKKHTLS